MAGMYINGYKLVTIPTCKFMCVYSGSAQKVGALVFNEGLTLLVGNSERDSRRRELSLLTKEEFEVMRLGIQAG